MLQGLPRRRQCAGARARRDVRRDRRTWRYTEDAHGRLATATQNGTVIGEYGYDANGNRLRVMNGPDIASYDAQDRILAHADTTYEHDAHGSRTAKHTQSGSTTYVYDARGALRSVTLPNGKFITYEIDGSGRRVGRKVDGVVTHRWVYMDSLRPVAALDATGNVRSLFVCANGGNVPAYVERDGVVYRIVTDRLGSVRFVVNVATGEVAQRMECDPWGQVTLFERTAEVAVEDGCTGTGEMRAIVPFGFAGGLWDRDTGLVRFGARDFDPEIGRWTARDPIRFRGGDANLYAYCNNDPVNCVDPEGLEGSLNLFSTRLEPDMWMRAALFPDTPFNRVTGHGDHTGMWRPGSDSRDKAKTANELARDLRNAPGFDESLPTALLGCNLASKGSTYCADVARELGQPVLCYDSFTWYDYGAFNGSCARKDGKQDCSKPGKGWWYGPGGGRLEASGPYKPWP